MKRRVARLLAAGGALDGDQRFAAGAALALLVTMFLPWYEKSVFNPKTGGYPTTTISAFGAVSFVEAAIFLVSAGSLVLVLTRAEGGKYHLPGGDGTVILVAGAWATLLIFYRVFDRPNVSGDAGTVGIQWGFFVAFVAAGALALAGQRMRIAARPKRAIRHRRPRPPEHVDFDDLDVGDPAAGKADGPAAKRRVTTAEPRRPRERTIGREDAEELTFDGEVGEPPARRRRTRRGSSDR